MFGVGSLKWLRLRRERAGLAGGKHSFSKCWGAVLLASWKPSIADWYWRRGWLVSAVFLLWIESSDIPDRFRNEKRKQNRGLSSLALESPPLIFGFARRRRGRGGAWRDAKCCGAGDNSAAQNVALGYPRTAKVGLLARQALSGKQCCMQPGRVRWANA